MRVVVVSNSQGTRAGVSRGENYPVVLRTLLPQHEWHLFLMSAWSVAHFNAHLENIVDLEPDLVVAQIGLIEAGRRILSTGEKRHLAKLGRLGFRFTGFLHRHRKEVILLRHRLGIDTRLMKPTEFERELEIFVRAVADAGSGLLLLEIPSFGDAYEREHYPLMNDDVALFNEILGRHGAVPLFREDDDLEGVWQPGTVHLNQIGHRAAAQRIASLVRAWEDVRQERQPDGRTAMQ